MVMFKLQAKISVILKAFGYAPLVFQELVSFQGKNPPRHEDEKNYHRFQVCLFVFCFFFVIDKKL